MKCPACGGARPSVQTSCPRCGAPGSGEGDLQAGVGTVVGKFDREQAVGTKVGPPPRRRLPDPPAAPGGLLSLPESTVSRDLDGTFMELRSFLLRMGFFGRLTFHAASLTLLAAFLPWQHRSGVGYAAGVEDSGWLTVGLVSIALALHVSRYRRSASLRPLLALGALFFSASTVASMLWVVRLNMAIDPGLRPSLAWGFWIASLAALVALLGTLVCLKDIRQPRP